MPINSAEISGLVGGQMAMFSNQASYAQQIGGIYGTGPYPSGTNLQNPYPQPPSYGLPGYGSQVLGGHTPGGFGTQMTATMGNALPAAAAGVSLGAGLIGGGMGMLDPFTGVARGFALGSGASSASIGSAMAGGGAGFGETMSHIGKGFMGPGGLARGAGMVGRGLAGASMAALPYWMAGEAISYAGQQMYQGAQNIAQVGDIMGRQGPAYGQAGVRPGGGQARQQIKDVTAMLHEIASEDVLTSMGDVVKLLSNAQSRGMLTGMMGSGDFKSKFKGIVDQVKDVAKTLGTSLEEAMPLYNQMRQMGMWKTSDIMGTSMAINQVGRQAAPALLGTMQQGAQMSWQQGGTMAAGATIGRQAFMGVQAATRTGVLSDEKIMELTGGVGGLEGQQMVAGKIGQGVSTFAQSSMGRLMMAGLGETKDGSFTGKIDERQMQNFMAGNVSIGDLQGRGRGRTTSRQGAVSYQYKSAQLGQEMMAKGGMEAVAKAIDSVMERSGYGGASDDIRGTFIQKMMGVDQREAEMWRSMIEELPKIEREKTRRAQDAMRDSFRRLDERKNRSWQGFKDAVKFMVEETVDRPMQEFSEKISTHAGQAADRLTDMIWGRTRQAGISGTEREKALTGAGGLFRGGGGGGGGGGVRGGGAGAVDLSTPMAEQLAMDPEGFMRTFGMMEDEKVWSRKNAFSQVSDITNTESVTFAARRSIMRAQGASLDSLGYGETQDKRRDMDLFKAGVDKLFIQADSSERLRKIKKETGANSGAYMKAIIKELESSGVDPEAAKALGRLTKGQSGDKLTNANLDMLAIAVTESGYKGELGPNLGRHALELSGIALNPKDIDKEINKSQEDIAKFVSESSEAWYDKVGKAYGAVAGAGINIATYPASLAMAAYTGIKKGDFLGSMVGLFTGQTGIGGFLKEATMGTGDMPVEDLNSAMSEEWGPDMVDWIEKGGKVDTKTNKFAQALASGDKKADTMQKLLAPIINDPSKAAELKNKMSGQLKLRSDRVKSEKIGEFKKFASDELQTISQLSLTDVKESTKESYKKVLSLYEAGDVTGARALEEKLAKEISGSQGDIAALGGQGAIGRGIASLSQFEKFDVGSKGMDKKTFAKEFNKRGGAAGVPSIEALLGSEFGADVSKMLEGGVTQDELGKIKDIARKVRMGPQAGDKEASSQDQLIKNLTSYADANTKFVWAVSQTIGKLNSNDVEKLQQQGEDLKKTLQADKSR